MNVRQSILLSAVAIAFAAPAVSFAMSNAPGQNGEAAAAISFGFEPSARTRMDVLQDLQTARMNGTVPVQAEGNLQSTPAKGLSKTRDQVKKGLSTSSFTNSFSSTI